MAMLRCIALLMTIGPWLAWAGACGEEGVQCACSLNGLEALVAAESFRILDHFGAFQEFCEVGRSMMEAWCDSDAPGVGSPGSEVYSAEDLARWRFYPGDYTYVDAATPCDADKSVRSCDAHGACRCSNATEPAFSQECGGLDGQGGLYPDINCWYWADRKPNRRMELYFPGWAYNYSYNFSEVSRSAKEEGSPPTTFAKPMRAEFDRNLTTPYIMQDSGTITGFCAARFPDCPSDTLTNPVSVADWKAGGGIAVQRAGCWADPTCRAAEITGKRLCPKLCLDPAKYGNNMLTYILAFASPLNGFFLDLYERFNDHVVAWYWWGNRGEGFYVPGFQPYDMGDFVGWDFQFPKMHYAGPEYNSVRKNVWSPTYLDGVSGNLMITPMTPVYIGDYWQGTVSVDLTMTKTQAVVENIRGTDNGLAILTTATGHVVAASQRAYDLLFCPNRNQLECTCTEEYEAMKKGEDVSCDAGVVLDRFALDKSWDPELQKIKGKRGAEGITMQEVSPFKGQVLELVEERLFSIPKGFELIRFCPDAAEPPEGEDVAAAAAACTTEYWAVWQRFAGKYADSIPWTLLVLVPKLEMDSFAQWQVDKPALVNPEYQEQVVTISNPGRTPVAWKAIPEAGMTVVPSAGLLEPSQESQLTMEFDRTLIDERLLQLDTDSLKLTLEGTGDSRACFPNIDVVTLFKVPCSPGYETLANRECSPCPAGTYSKGAGMTCTTCLAGTYALAASGSCNPCPPGQYSASDGSALCAFCLPGSAVNISGASSCELCQPGSIAARPSTATCTPCNPGQVAPSSGATACTPCALGQFMVEFGETECASCTQQLTTAVAGTTSEVECVCRSGFYHGCSGEDCAVGVDIPAGSGFCDACPAGMTCEGPEENLQAYVQWSSELSVYRHLPPFVAPATMSVGNKAYSCVGDGSACPGAPMGAPVEEMCAHGGTGIACSECSAGSMFDGSKCLECNRTQMISLAFLFVLTACVLALLYSSTAPPSPSFDQRYSDNVMNSSVVVMTISNVAYLFQVMSVLKNANVRWPNLPRALLDDGGSVFELSAFNIPCMSGQSPREFAVVRTLMVNLLPVCLIAVTAIYYAMGTRPRPACVPWRLWPDQHRAVNAFLGFFASLFMTVANSAINTAFATFTHPCGEVSLSFYPFLIEGDSEVGQIRIISVVGIIVWCVGGLAGYMWLLSVMPKYASNKKFVLSTSTMVARFKPKAPWWFLLTLIRALLTALSLSVSQDGSTQLLLIAVLTSLYIVALTLNKPYYCGVCFWADLTTQLGLLLLLAGGLATLASEGNAWAVAAGLFTAVAASLIHCGIGLYVFMKYKVSNKPCDLMSMMGPGMFGAVQNSLPHACFLPDLLDSGVPSHPQDEESFGISQDVMVQSTIVSHVV